MDLTLGRRPGTLLVLLSRSTGLHTVLERKVDGIAVPWPAGAQIELELFTRTTSTAHPFVVSGSTATLALTAVPAPLPTDARIWVDYGDEYGRFLWLEGKVEVGA